MKKWWTRYRQEGNFKTKARSGRPRKTTFEQDDEIMNAVKTNPFLKAAKIARHYQLSTPTITSRFKERGITCHVAAKQTALTEDHRIYRMAFAKKMTEQFNQAYFDSIIFSDEKTFASDLDHQVLVYRPANTRYDPKFVATEKLSGRISCSFWGAIGPEGPLTDLFRITGHFNSLKYLRLVQRKITPLLQRFDNQRVYMQDNSRVHTANVVMEYFAKQPYKILDWPACSPDLNPIENVWSRITHEWPKMQHRSQAALENIAVERWNELRLEPGYYKMIEEISQITLIEIHFSYRLFSCAVRLNTETISRNNST